MAIQYHLSPGGSWFPASDPRGSGAASRGRQRRRRRRRCGGLAPFSGRRPRPHAVPGGAGRLFGRGHHRGHGRRGRSGRHRARRRRRVDRWSRRRARPPHGVLAPAAHDPRCPRRHRARQPGRGHLRGGACPRRRVRPRRGGRRRPHPALAADRTWSSKPSRGSSPTSTDDAAGTGGTLRRPMASASSPTILGLDGDDTLWRNEEYFADTQEFFRGLVAPFANGSDLDAQLAANERRNLELFGFGVKGFTLSMIETAIEVSWRPHRQRGGAGPPRSRQGDAGPTGRAARRRGRDRRPARHPVPARAHHQGRPAPPGAEARPQRPGRAVLAHRDREREGRAHLPAGARPPPHRLASSS